jgi:hypothetical protein
MELTPEERQRIYLEEKARSEARQTLETQKRKHGSGAKIGILALAVSALFVVSTVIIHKSEAPTASNGNAVEGTNSTGNPAHDELLAHTVRQQAFLLGKIVQEGCVGNRVFYQGMDKERDAFWSVGCKNGRSYQVELRPDSTGSGKILECSFLKRVGLNCFVKLKD